MSVVALTGGIGSGKSEAARLFAQLGIPIVDTDIIAHQLTGANQAAIDEIRATFGDEFINAQGAMNREKMREHIFKNPNARQQLEQILHPKIHAEVLRQISINAHSLTNNICYQIVVVPLLFESNRYDQIANIKCVVDCDPALQILRTMQRSQLNEESVIAIMKAQVSRETRLSRADEIIENNGNINHLTDKVHKMHEKLTKICLKFNNI